MYSKKAKIKIARTKASRPVNWSTERRISNITGSQAAPAAIKRRFLRDSLWRTSIIFNRRLKVFRSAKKSNVKGIIITGSGESKGSVVDKTITNNP